eukprot:10420860-Prorocentrum_lima.AAC.1
MPRQQDSRSTARTKHTAPDWTASLQSTKGLEWQLLACVGSLWNASKQRVAFPAHPWPQMML